ncbi:MAG: hypothetical protein QM817_29325 [Archangium sp.]
MQTLLLLSVLAQAPVVVTPVSPATAAPAFRTFSDGKRSFKLYESAVLVAEPKPADAVAARVRELDASAVVVLERPTMRVWKVRDAKAVRAAIATLRPAFHDVADGGGRYRVPMGLVCDGVRRDAEWLEVLERSGASCLPDFWYPPTLR